MENLEFAHAAIANMTEIMNNFVKQSEEMYSLSHMGAPTGILKYSISQLESLVGRLATVNQVIRMMQELNHSLGQSVKIDNFKVSEYEKGRKQYINVEYTYNLSQFQTPTVVSFVIGYSNNKIAVYYNNDELCKATAKHFKDKWWPKIAAGIMNNMEKV